MIHQNRAVAPAWHRGRTAPIDDSQVFRAMIFALIFTELLFRKPRLRRSTFDGRGNRLVGSSGAAGSRLPDGRESGQIGSFDGSWVSKGCSSPTPNRRRLQGARNRMRRNMTWGSLRYAMPTLFAWACLVEPGAAEAQIAVGVSAGPSTHQAGVKRQLPNQPGTRLRGKHDRWSGVH